ncbi:SUMF1/EgtB/PvdO family nonheme iron enzyme [Candidatus Fermentibacteria bacterium]|nr:SUMF1/EgtB/PvdO family nonheme iron enzyme [Candidatus Fermentibacteria bacterium]
MSYQPGQIVVRRFELRQKLGAGGMGIVFGAQDRELDEVALKFLPDAMAGDPEAVSQFAREVKRARKVSGRNILRVYDLWDDGEGGRFVTMEWAKGGDLAAYRRRYGTLSWEQVKALMLPILKGLQAVHEAGIVHRDIKPGNILFREDGTPVVADFGISKSIMSSMSRISQDATISGTPAYMAPEAIRGGSEIGFHTDLYAIGCMAYELLAGHTPFVGDPMSVMYNQTQSDPSFTGMPPEAIRWIGACMVKDPGRRVRSAEELIRGLEDPSRLPAYVPSGQAAFGGAVQALPYEAPPRQPPPSTRPPQASRPEPPRVSPHPESDRTYKVKAAPPRAAEREPKPRPAPTGPRRGVDRQLVILGSALVVLVAILGGLLLRETRKSQAPAPVARNTIQPPATTSGPVTPTPTPPATDTRRQRIMELEGKARSQLAGKKYTSPIGDNSWETCEELGRLDPGNAVRADVIRQMQAAYEGMIEGRLAAGECAKAEEHAGALRKVGGYADYSVRLAECVRQAEETRREHEAAAARERAAREAEAERVRLEKEARERAARQLVEMVRIQGGTFQMGSNDGDSDEKPVHSVTVSSFSMGKYEVTQEQYQAVMGTNPSRFKGAKRPVEQVSWNDAVEFCKKLSDREGLTRCYSGSGSSVTCNWGANGYRLPTEAEWEYACRAGTTGEYNTGSGEAALGRAGWYSGNSSSQTHDVGGKQANAFGLYDTHGNVWEWCWDWYGSYSSGSQTDPKGASSGSFRVYRGGGWYGIARGCRSASRYGYGPGSRGNGLGFRLVRR